MTKNIYEDLDYKWLLTFLFKGMADIYPTKLVFQIFLQI